ncbi:MAG: Nramp family divalent metal transporter [Candidatus Dormibacteraeota bacterium]|nr:Nramp family divalent metal transporter [Candidatus Dormibacteraeota bacterium]MDQ6900857.1 Nramp family divalent metal transporter [Candidatus Dormibacteraeota bacterium]
MGPGLITGASDDDPSGIGTYSQVGSQFGFGLLWMAVFTFPLMSAIQELSGRIALHTGVGLGVSLRRKFPSWLVAICILALLVANTINVGADLGAVATGASLLTLGHVPELWLVIPVALLVLYMQFFLSYRTVFRIFKWLTLALFAYVVTGILARPPALQVLRATVIPHIELSPAFLAAVVAVLGTTISPYLFFWQASSEVDEMTAAGRNTEAARRGVHWTDLKAARADILIGMAFSQIVMYFIILTTATVLHAHGKTDIQTADQAAQALAPFLGPFAFVAFAMGMIGTGLLAIPILSGSAAYAVKEFMGWRGSLRSKPQSRPLFYGVIGLATLVGLGLNFLRIDPTRALFYAAVINGLVAPPLMVLMVLLGSDRKVMKDKVSGRLSLTLTGAASIAMTGAAIALVATTVLARLR